MQRRRAVEVEAARKALEASREQTRAEYARGIVNDLAEAEQKAAQTAQELIKAEKKIQDQVLGAPMDGTVQQLAVHTVGGVVTPAQALMVVVPADAHVEVEAMVLNSDIGFVHDGDPAEINVDTFNFTKYGLLHGKVISPAPGMAVTVEIRTGQRRVIEYLLSPLLRYRHEAARER
jgi:hemolysin D